MQISFHYVGVREYGFHLKT